MSVNENCDKCNNDYVIGQDNGQVFLFMDFPQANHLKALCTHCGNVEILFLTTDGFMRIMSQTVFHVTFASDAPDDLKARATRAWAGQDGEPLTPPYTDLPLFELTPRLEQYVENLRQLLENLPPGHFVEEMRLPMPPMRFPQRWISDGGVGGSA